MTITLSSKARSLVNARLKSGRYSSAEEVVMAGLNSLRRQEELGDFAAGELPRLVAEGERSIEQEGTVGAEEVFAALRKRAGLRSNRRGASRRKAH
jgi:putative addiction module CopG family antidote